MKKMSVLASMTHTTVTYVTQNFQISTTFWQARQICISSGHHIFQTRQFEFGELELHAYSKRANILSNYDIGDYTKTSLAIQFIINE